MKASTAITIITLSLTGPLLGGCAVGLVAPAVAGMNMAKNGPIQMKIEGKGDAALAFRRAAIEAGGTIPRTSQGYVEAIFSSKAAKVELQEIEPGRYAVGVTSTAARSWDFEDGLAKIADAISAGMGKQGFVTTLRERTSGL